MLIKFIQDILMTKSGKFDSNKCNISWYIKNGYLSEYNEILDKTNFLINYTFSARIYCILNNITSNLCGECNIGLLKFINSSEGFTKTCSSKCAANSVSRWEKYKSTNLEKYGFEFATQSSIVKDKTNNTMLEKYGVISPIQSPEFRIKMENTNLEKYGSKFGFGSKIIQDKILKTNNDRYGANVPNSNPEVLKFLTNESWLRSELLLKNTKTISSELGCSVTFINYWARQHNIEDRITIYSEENAIFDYILDLGIKKIEQNVYGIIGNISGLGRRQLDLYIPEKMLAIELNGVYWHSGDKVRHLEKLNLCKDKNIKLLQFWDFHWNDKEYICRSIIKSNLGLNDRIYARKCKIVKLSSKIYKNFLNDNHLQGSVNSSIKYGLIYNGKLVSVIGFSKSRYDKSYTWELIRYANILNTNVIGGFSKLLSYFRQINPGNIISYCDLMVFDGRMYKEAGFIEKFNTQPGFFYFKGNKVYNREQLQKHKLQNILKYFDNTLTADQNILNNGYGKVWNCGNGVWELI